jgi:hypothetical protein
MLAAYSMVARPMPLPTPSNGPIGLPQAATRSLLLDAHHIKG